MRVGVKGGVCLGVFLCWAVLAGAQEINPYRADLAVKEYERRLKAAGFLPEDLRVHSIGQSHIDAAWRWRLAQTRIKVYRTWGQAVEFMKRYPEFTFSGSSGQYYEWLLEEHPELFAEIQEMEKIGRWEIVGGMWVEPDCNMPSGESFARQLLLGQRFYLEHFGHITEISWLLDSFGYNRNLPQLVGRAGCKYMWTSKLTWNDTTIFPFHNFHWRGPDGTQVLTHICPIVPLPLFFPFSELDKYRDTRWLLKPGVKLVANYATLPETIAAALSDDWLNVIGVFYGVGDGGLGPREIEIEIQRALAAKGYTRFTGARAMFEEIAAAADRLPVWDDEMYLEFHRGVMTTQSWIKEANRRAEVQIQTAEALRSFLSVLGVRYPYEELKNIWKRILLNQFHDILPGSSIPEVFEDARKDYQWIHTSTWEIKDAGLRELAGRVNIKPPAAGAEAIVVFNSLPWKRSGLVSVEIRSGGPYEIFDPSGASLPSQMVEKNEVDYLLFRASDVPSLGYKTYFIKKAERAPAEGGGPAILDSDSVIALENEYVKVTVDKDEGWIRSVFDKKNCLQLIKGSANRLLAFYDRPKVYSAWDISTNYLERPIPIPAAESITVTARGPLFSEISIKRTVNYLEKDTTFDQRVRLVHGDPVVYLDLISDYHLTDSLTKLEFNTILHSDTIAAENAYFVMERPTHPQTAAERARWEMVCQKWIDLSSPEAGLALLNKGKYGFSLNEDGTGFRQTMIKGARYPRANPGAKDVKHRFQSFPIPTGWTDQGPQFAELGLLAHVGTWRQARLWEAGYNFNTPLEAVWVTPHEGPLPAEGSFMWLESASVMIGAVKRAEEDGDLVVRLVEMTGNSSHAVIHFGLGLKPVKAVETDLIELNPKTVSVSGGTVSLSLGPYEIRTLKITVSR